MTNDDRQARVVNVEPYGDSPSLEPTDSLTVEVAAGPDVLIELALSPGHVGEVLWMAVDGGVVAASDLKVNGRTIWPA
ncbi:hypothetical protein [Cellulomonas sp. NS3]|uniref:hypothetical protein n=1 Tax=Cellulomonas sp. NS3 TaxID=2973977 RepID=UPI002163DA07|nr:hypothetical protein [Cellulomonas sp. NS3]